jgi:hypothetical protein
MIIWMGLASGEQMNYLQGVLHHERGGEVLDNGHCALWKCFFEWQPAVWGRTSHASSPTPPGSHSTRCRSPGNPVALVQYTANNRRRNARESNRRSGDPFAYLDTLEGPAVEELHLLLRLVDLSHSDLRHSWEREGDVLAAVHTGVGEAAAPPPLSNSSPCAPRYIAMDVIAAMMQAAGRIWPARDALPARVSAGHGFGRERGGERGVGENREGPSEIDEVTVGGHARLEHTAAPGGLSVGDTGMRTRGGGRQSGGGTSL